VYPLKFKKHFVEKVWGGRAFDEVLDMNLPNENNFGESWEVSSHQNGMSFVESGEFEGKSLQELLETHKDKLVGKKVYNKYGDKFPILVKYLDVNDKLSVQVHPSDDYALEVEGEFGKSECWYIIDASEDAKLIMGLKEGMTKEEFLRKTETKDFDDMFNIISVKKGDFINVKPGVVHASLEGSVLICEPQQNSDTTYRIYDFDRLVDGVLRPLHLEKAADVIDFNGKPEISTDSTRASKELAGATMQELVKCEYFSSDKLFIDGTYEDQTIEGFKVFSILDGQGEINHNGVSFKAVKGDTYFIPANLDVTLTGKLEVLKTYL